MIKLDKKNSTRLIGLITGFANGLFGSGGGTVVVPCMEKYLDINAHKSHATAIAIILPLSILSAVIYIFKTDVPWAQAAAASAGGIVGGFIGAKLLNKVSGRWLHIIFGIAMLAAAVRMLI
ncbi:hypothetical protein IMSAG049_00881 [Clostridiales bacterium]|nr:hypothetical protein IMSAG049_00881 [Clostridiales bacterium]